MSLTRISNPRWVSASFVPPPSLEVAALPGLGLVLVLALPQMLTPLEDSATPRSEFWARTADCCGCRTVVFHGGTCRGEGLETVVCGEMGTMELG